MRPITPYISTQIEHEEKYYQKFTVITAGLIAYLLDYIKKNPNITMYLLKSQYEIWLRANNIVLVQLSKETAFNITNIGLSAVGTKNTANRALNIAKDVEVYQINTIQSAFSEVMKILPIAAAGLFTYFFTDEVTQADIYRRSNNYVKRMVRDVYTDGVFNTIMIEASSLGYKGYVANNQHDDKVRPLHRKYFDGKRVIMFNKPPKCGHVGTQNFCRCYIVAVL